ncbi:hypothetical protein HDU76_009309 [Blyttiomyces sp. JEL0837]|nr:hypothetical protein HDU76_009309 [Blyttiomyces sp. JEL0837]
MTSRVNDDTVTNAEDTPATLPRLLDSGAEAKVRTPTMPFKNDRKSSRQRVLVDLEADLISTVHVGSSDIALSEAAGAS